MKAFTPTYFEKSVFGIELGMLKQKGIKLLILDIDNTLVPRSVYAPTDEVRSWLFKVASFGFDVAFISNGPKDRVEEFCEGVYFYVGRACKPLTSGIKAAMQHFNVRRRHVCLIGDQLFTDIWGANRAKIMSILVDPIDPEDEGLGVKFKRILEKPILSAIKPMQFALIGNPVFHSKSPMIHQKIYKRNKINADYKLYEPEENEIPELIQYFREAGYIGFNITVPYKQTIMQYLDHISDDAQAIGAVNTVYIKNDMLYGYNTDGDGFTMQLEKNGTRMKDAKVKIVGAGGATPSIVHALIAKGVESIVIYNRTLSKAEKIAEMNTLITPRPLEEFSADDCDILINTTSVGLDSYDCPVESFDGISPDTVVYDIIYSPSTTTFMQKALDRGVRAHNGLDMLRYQGLLADQIWLGKEITL